MSNDFDDCPRAELAMMKRIGAMEERFRILPLLHEIDKVVACIGGSFNTPLVSENLTNQFYCGQEELKRYIHEIEAGDAK